MKKQVAPAILLWRYPTMAKVAQRYRNRGTHGGQPKDRMGGNVESPCEGPRACCAYADFQGYRIVAPGTGHGLRRGQPSVHVCHAAQSAAISRCIAMILPRQIQGYAASWATARPYIRVLCFVQLPWLRAPILPGYPAKARGTYEARMNA
jgi:hypothetical protein